MIKWTKRNEMKIKYPFSLTNKFQTTNLNGFAEWYRLKKKKMKTEYQWDIDKYNIS